MKIVKLKGGGGLGNQMFEYAFAKLIEKRFGEEVKLDLSAFTGLTDAPEKRPSIFKFKLSLPAATQKEICEICKLRHGGNSQSKAYKAKLLAEIFINRRYYFEWDRAPRDVDKLLRYDYYDGYWQSWEYVDEVFDILKQEFVPNDELHESTNRMIHKVANENSVFVGIRLGDYTSNKKLYGSFGQSYYQAAMAYIEQYISDPIYYIFSNDILQVKRDMNFGDRNIVYREEKDIVDDFEELLLMMNCRHSIVTNSTYHWWGSRMNDCEQKIVVAPQTWFFDGSPIDVIPPRWVKMNNT